MKRKLLGICILALLVIVMMPMTSAAPPADQRIREVAYQLGGCGNPLTRYAECTSVGAKRGSVVFNSLSPTTGCGEGYGFDESFSIRKLPPGSQWYIVLMSPYSGGKTMYSGTDYLLGGLIPDEHGRYKHVISPRCQTEREWIKAKLESGYFVGLMPVPVA